jgi:hypothetical protein
VIQDPDAEELARLLEARREGAILGRRLG